MQTLLKQKQPLAFCCVVTHVNWPPSADKVQFSINEVLFEIILVLTNIERQKAKVFKKTYTVPN